MAAEEDSIDLTDHLVRLASLVEAARELDRQCGGTELARMPKETARLTVNLKKAIQDYDQCGGGSDA